MLYKHHLLLTIHHTQQRSRVVHVLHIRRSCSPRSACQLDKFIFKLYDVFSILLASHWSCKPSFHHYSDLSIPELGQVELGSLAVNYLYTCIIPVSYMGIHLASRPKQFKTRVSSFPLFQILDKVPRGARLISLISPYVRTPSCCQLNIKNLMMLQIHVDTWAHTRHTQLGIDEQGE